MRISEVARLAGTTVRTIRHYHAIGLLAEPARLPNGYRDYSAADLLRVLRIRQLASLGFSLGQVPQVLERLDAVPDADPGDAGAGDAGAGAGEKGTGDAGAGDAGAGDADAGEKGDADPGGAGEPGVDLLAELDRALERQVEELQRKRELVARLRAGRGYADYPGRASGALDAVARVAREGGPGFLDAALRSRDASLLGVAAHLYGPDDLGEVERVFTAIAERGLEGPYARASELVASLPPDADEAARDEAAEACLAFLDLVLDCFDPSNWSGPPSAAEVALRGESRGDFNEAQLDVSDRVFSRLERRLRARCGGGEEGGGGPVDPDVTS